MPRLLINSIPGVLALAIACPANPQTADTSAEPIRIIESIGATGAEGSRVVTRMSSRSGEDAGCIQKIPPVPDAKTVTFVIPPQDRHYYTYRIAHFDEGGGGSSTVTPDEYGIIHGEVGAQRIVDAVMHCSGDTPPPSTREEAPEQYYLVATDIDTGEMYYTMDLPQVRLTALLWSLQSTRSRLPANRDDRGAWSMQRMEVRNHNNILARDIQLALTGDMLSLDQVLDAVYVSTGCFADIADGFIIIERC